MEARAEGSPLAAPALADLMFDGALINPGKSMRFATECGLCNNKAMTATARISSKNGHTVVPAAVRKFLGLTKGSQIKYESKANGEVIIKPLPTLEALFGSLKGDGVYHADESAQGWAARTDRVLKKGWK
jgi:bifunctional DNA-binding transcriptional regulator/antitoxin component of YhaV-PrlF toxin-antitoxin module